MATHQAGTPLIGWGSVGLRLTIAHRLDRLIANNGLHDFDETRDQGEFLRVPIPGYADAPQRFLPAQFMKSYSRHLEAQGRPRDQRDPHASSNQVEDGQDFVCFLNDPGSESGAEAKA